MSEAREVADAVRRVLVDWEAATASGAAACGLPFAVEAYERMRLAWSAELRVHAAVLDGMAGADDGD